MGSAFVASPALAADEPEVAAANPDNNNNVVEPVKPAAEEAPIVVTSNVAMPVSVPTASGVRPNLAAANPQPESTNTPTPTTTTNTPPPYKGERAGSELRDPNAGEHLRFGPLVGVGFPRPLAIEALVKIERIIGLGAEYSFLPRVNLFGAETSFKAVAADVRVFPFKGSFFFGARAGRQWLDAKTTLTVGQGASTIGSFTETMEAATWFVNPRIGFLKTWESGITVGIDAGVQLPINPTYARSGPATTAGVASSGVDNTLRGVAGVLGNNVTPTIDVLRLGFMF